MKFSKIYGKVDRKIVKEAEDKLSGIFSELALSFDNKTIGTNIGGDPLVFQLVSPVEHICDATAIEFDAIDEKMKKFGEEVKAASDRGETPQDNTISDEFTPTEEEIRKFKAKMKGKVLRTAATDGKRFYWNPEFVNKTSRAGLRIVVAHEAWHAIYMHPSRRAARMPRLWNIAVDYKVNNTVMLDLTARKSDHGRDSSKETEAFFIKSLGDYIKLDEYAQFLKDPFNPPPRLAHFNPIHDMKKGLDPAYGHPGKDHAPMYFSDSVLPEDMKRPEHIYDHLLSQVPKCPECGKLGMYKKPEEVKQLQKQLKEKEAKEASAKKKEKEEKQNVSPGVPTAPSNKTEKSDKQNKTAGGNGSHQHSHSHSHSHGNENGETCEHDHGDEAGNGQEGHENATGQNGEGGGPTAQMGGSEQAQSEGESKEDDCGHNAHSCGTCGGDDTEYYDPFEGGGDLIDEHFDTDISEDELARRMEDAVAGASRMGGTVPAGLSDELGLLLEPTIKWEEIVLGMILKVKRGTGRNDWNSFRNKPMFSGLLIPKKKDYHVNILSMIDCSGSMSRDDIAYGVSQLQVVGECSTMWLLPFDTVPYFEAMIKINKADVANLQTAKVKGRGGTAINLCFNQYEEHIGKVDIIIAITDGFLSDMELRDVKIDKNTKVVWLITANNPAFKPPFGKVFNLRNEKIMKK